MSHENSQDATDLFEAIGQALSPLFGPDGSITALSFDEKKKLVTQISNYQPGSSRAVMEYRRIAMSLLKMQDPSL
jgi:hypothetical protein